MKKPLSSHPAVAAAESDLVKLCREFEDLKSQIERGVATLKESSSLMQAAVLEYEQACTRHQEVIALVERNDRVLTAKLTNAKLLLSQVIGPTYDSGRACN